MYVCVHAGMCVCMLMCVYYMYAGNFWFIRGCVFSHKPGAVLFIYVFAAMGDWLYAEDLETEDFTMPVSDLYLDRNSCSPHSFGTFSISSFSLQFVISENNP